MKSFRVILIFLLFALSCSEPIEEKPGQSYRFHKKIPKLGKVYFDLKTPNGSWFEPSFEAGVEGSLKEKNILFVLSKSPSNREIQLTRSIADEEGFSYFYLNQLTVEFDDSELSTEETIKNFSDGKFLPLREREIKKQVEDFEIVSSVEKKIMGFRTKVLEFKGDFGKLGRLLNQVYFILIKGHIFKIKFQCLEIEKKNFLPELNKIISSLRIWIK